MNGINYSLRGLLLLTLGTAMFLGAVRYQSVVVAQLMVFAAVLLWAFAVLGSLLRRGEARNFWIGVAVCGGVYLVWILFLSSIYNPGERPFPASVMRYLLRTAEFPLIGEEEGQYSQMVGTSWISISMPEHNVVQMGYAFCGVLIGLAGGNAGLWFARQNQRE